MTFLPLSLAPAAGFLCSSHHLRRGFFNMGLKGFGGRWRRSSVTGVSFQGAMSRPRPFSTLCVSDSVGSESSRWGLGREFLVFTLQQNSLHSRAQGKKALFEGKGQGFRVQAHLERARPFFANPKFA